METTDLFQEVRLCTIEQEDDDLEAHLNVNCAT